ncbi:putative ribonuclease H-like domain-containing protein, partial [Tanacetum coccineum]
PDNDNDKKDKSEDDSSPKEVNIAGQHVNTASPKVTTGRFKLNTIDPSVNTASSSDPYSLKDMFTMGASHTLEATHVEFFSDEVEPEVDLGNILNSYIVPTTPNTRIHKDHPIKNVIGDVKSYVQTRRMTKPTSEQGFISAVYKQKTHDTLNTCLYACFLSQIEPTSITKALSDSSWVEAMQEELLQFKLQQVWIHVDFHIGKRAIGTKWVLRNKKDERGIVIRNKARLVTQGHRQEEGVYYEEVFAPVARIEAIRLFLAYASFMGFLVYQMDVKSAFLYGTIEEEVYVDDIIFGSINKELCTAFEKLMKDKFQMSSMGELTFFLGLQVQQKEDGIFISQDKYVAKILKKFNYTDVKTASTPVDLEKPLVKDGDANDVDVHIYRSMIRSLMYLTASRPDIMFEVCACARFQVTPKTSHLLAVKRIFRYLKGKPTLGLWYSRDSLFELVAYTDSDYAGATQDRKSTTGESKTSGLFKEVSGLQSISGSGPLTKVGDEACSIRGGEVTEWKGFVPLTNSSLEAEQDSVNAIRHMLMLPVQVTAAEGLSDGFAEIIDFQKASSVHYALTVNPIIYTSCIEQFWATAKVLDLEKAKDAQAKEIAALKKRIQRLERKKMSRPTGLKRLKKVGMSRRVKSFEDQESLVALKDASKQGRRSDKDDDVTLVDESQERQDDDIDVLILSFDTDEDACGSKSWNEKPLGSHSPSALSLMRIVIVGDSVTTASNPKVVTTASQQTNNYRPKAKGVSSTGAIHGKIHSLMEADRLLAERLQSKEKEELTDEEKGKLFMELMEKRRKHFAALRAQEKRNIPPTKAQKRTQMSTYLKVNTFVAMGSKVQESKEKKVEGSEEIAKGSRKKMLGRKRARKEQHQESSKKQRMDEDKELDEVKEVSEDNEDELKKHLVIKKDEDIAIDAIPLATKLPVIIDYKIHKEGMLVHYQLIRADGSSKRYSSMIRMLQGIDREDLEALWRIVKTKYSDIRPEDEFERVL